MIARFWSAQAKPEHAPAYAEHLSTQVLPVLRHLPGYAGAMLLQRDLADEVEIVVITWWQSRDAIQAFAGDRQDRAVVASEAAVLLTRADEYVRHYDLILCDEVEGMRCAPSPTSFAPGALPGVPEVASIARPSSSTPGRFPPSNR